MVTSVLPEQSWQTGSQSCNCLLFVPLHKEFADLCSRTWKWWLEVPPLKWDPTFFFFLICFWLCWFFVAVHRVPPAAARGLLPFTVVFRLPFAVASHCRAGALGHMDFSSCDYRALEHGLSSCVMALVASWHVGSCRIRDWTWVPCIGMQILILWTAREDLGSQF